MSFNGSGTFTLAEAPFVPNTPISSSAVNSDLSDIATNGLTNCVTKDGQTTITAPFKGANGSVGLPMYSFASDTNTGMYRHGADELGFSTAGTLAGWFNSAQKFFMLGAADVAGLLTGVDETLSGVLTLSTTGYMLPPIGTTGQRPGSPVAGQTRYNSTFNQLEYYNGAGWALLRAATDPPQAAFKNLSIKVASNTTVNLAADAVITTDGTLSQNTAVSSTINLGTTGANALDTGTIAIDSWYAIWTIAKTDGTTAGLASLSFTAPTMPSGYTYKARVGAVQTIHATATLYGTWQFGRKAQYVLGLAQTALSVAMATGTAGTYSFTSPTLVTVAVARFVPPTASRIVITANDNYTNQTGSNIIVAPSQAYSGTNAGPGGANGFIAPLFINSAGGGSQIATVEMLLETTTVSWCSSAAGGSIICQGWEDNI